MIKEIILQHKSGPVTITIAARSKESAEYVAARIGGLFSQALAKEKPASFIEELLRKMS